MFNIRYGIKFMTEHVVFMGAADTSNNIMHFSWSEGEKKEEKPATATKKIVPSIPNMTFYLLVR